jgi:DNA gyrase subunit A
MRYTEARLAPVTQAAFLADLDKDVVDFIPNFDETEKEPSVLPARIPNLLVNGAEGIAVGMATSIPPHNLGEVVDATRAYLLNENITTAELMEHITGPDFPTGGIVINKDDLAEIYATGSGKIKVRGKVSVERGKGGRTNLVITEIPYPMIGGNISKFLSDVAALYETKKTQDIVDISNQSSKEGIRIVIELKKDANIEHFTNMLYKKTRLEDTFGVNMLAIVNGRPETMGIKRIIAENVAFQLEVTRRKYTTLLAKELERKEIQEGLIKACNVIDLIIEILRGSKDRKQAFACLTKGAIDGIKFRSKESGIMATQLSFTDKQANAILEMRLYRLIGLEIQALLNEHEETMANIYRYEDILERKDSMVQVIINELDEIKRTFARPRRTAIENRAEAVYEEKKMEEMEIIFLMDRFGYAKTVEVAAFERNKEAAEAENRYIFPCKNTGRICIFTNTGQLYTVKVVDLPFGKFRDKGIPIDNVSNYNSEKERMVCVTSQTHLNLYRVIFATKLSMLKVVDGGEFDVAKRTVAATKLMEGDEVLDVTILDGQQSVVLKTAGGFFLRFAVDEIPEKKKGAVGVRGMKLAAGDVVDGVYYLGTTAMAKTKMPVDSEPPADVDTAEGAMSTDDSKSIDGSETIKANEAVKGADLPQSVEAVIEYNGKALELDRLKMGKRDGKGTKIRK